MQFCIVEISMLQRNSTIKTFPRIVDISSLNGIADRVPMALFSPNSRFGSPIMRCNIPSELISNGYPLWRY